MLKEKEFSLLIIMEDLQQFHKFFQNKILPKFTRYLTFYTHINGTGVEVVGEDKNYYYDITALAMVLLDLEKFSAHFLKKSVK